ncbi:hypothetical protein [Sphingobium indicum]|uniref:hypothetical protein n=1 Tax=Sphingobium indicum TaxID=332055 RepID=UPI0012DC8892|nr:hypothetical protein [Sphingobium indicum]
MKSINRHIWFDAGRIGACGAIAAFGACLTAMAIGYLFDCGWRWPSFDFVRLAMVRGLVVALIAFVVLGVNSIWNLRRAIIPPR